MRDCRFSHSKHLGNIANAHRLTVNCKEYTTEIFIQRALDELCKGRTTIVVAHRLSTVKNANKIAVVSEGRITELGNHNELMNIENGHYKALYEMQFRTQEV